MATILTKTTIYLGKNLFGIADKVTCPEIDMETTEIKNGIGSYNLPTAVKAMTGSINLNGFDIDVFNKISNPFNEINMTIYGSLDEYQNETLAKETQAKVILRGSSQKFGLLGELTQQENLNYSMDFNYSCVKLYIAGVEKFAVDIPNLILKIGGKDVLEQMRKNLALN